MGGKVPWWPAALRRNEDMLAWHPDDGTITVPAITDGDTEALLRVAVDAHPDSPVHVTLTALARTLHVRGTEYALDSTEQLLNESDVTEVLLLAARPTPNAAHDDPVSPLTQQRAWMEILGRTDSLARRCVRTARMWDGGEHFPYSTTEQIRTPWGPTTWEWHRRLEKVPARLAPAAVDLVRRPGMTSYYTDPLTGAPAGVDEEGHLLATVPHQLPTTSPLAEVILSDGVPWVRTEDSRLYLMPQTSGAGLSFGYVGTGPATLAVMIGRLLDDIQAPAVGSRSNLEPSSGLEKIAQAEHEHTVLSRAELETARHR